MASTAPNETPARVTSTRAEVDTGRGARGGMVAVRTDVRDMEGMYRGPPARVVFGSDAVS
jgi:hypothetical protein